MPAPQRRNSLGGHFNRATALAIGFVVCVALLYTAYPPPVAIGGVRSNNNNRPSRSSSVKPAAPVKEVSATQRRRPAPPVTHTPPSAVVVDSNPSDPPEAHRDDGLVVGAVVGSAVPRPRWVEATAVASYGGGGSSTGGDEADGKQKGEMAFDGDLLDVGAFLRGYSSDAVRGHFGDFLRRDKVVKVKKTGLPKDRCPSDPYITGDGFRPAADYIYDDARMEPASALEAVVRRVGATRPIVLFLQTHEINKFIEEVWKPVVMTQQQSSAESSRFVLVSHNSDYSAPWERSNVRGKFGVTAYKEHREILLEHPFLVKWFGQNAIIRHPKLFPLPIGIENRYNKVGGQLDEFYVATVKEKRGSVQPPAGGTARLLYANFNVKTNPTGRGQLLHRLKELQGREGGGEAITIDVGAKLPLREMATNMMRHWFVAAPPGHGLDTHRLWEALYFGCTPITVSSTLDPMLMEFPIVILKDWTELTIGRLREEQGVVRKRWAAFNKTKLTMAYWRRRVHLLEV